MTAIPLRQSTPGQKRPLGPFFDETDGFTRETALSIANTDIRLWKDSATAVDKNSGGAAHVEHGVYWPEFDEIDSDTAGPLTVECSIAGARAVRQDYIVYSQNVYDAMIAGTAQVTEDTIALANRVEMDANSTKLAAIITALGTLPADVGAVNIDGTYSRDELAKIHLALAIGAAAGLTGTTKIFRDQSGNIIVTATFSDDLDTRTVVITL